MEKYIVIHGHFYQPPRENPWLERIEVQDSAYPYHDWNSRILAECYAPNTASHILDSERRIIDMRNNYSRISFDFGPTLLSWMEWSDREIYEAILDADSQSRKRFSGHGSAMAQAYNHTILPLANARDKGTQILWGIYDFKKRFNRDPEGLWLPETAVDLESLDIMAQNGIRFTVLAPRQAGRIKRMEDGDDSWQEVPGDSIDTQRSYLCRLPSGMTISIFFYDSTIAREVAFSDLLTNGERFAHRILSAFKDEHDEHQLVNVATDGETYGHYQIHGDMALAYCLYYLENKSPAKLTNYGEFLEHNPPKHEVQIVENTSWSCIHGIERWRADCGCASGTRPGWNQTWRAPLRGAMDWLRDNVSEIYQDRMFGLIENPWHARDDYIEIILDRSEETTGRFFEKHAAGLPDHDGMVKALQLFEMQRHAMQMYTSWGWYFDEVSGLETIQVLRYAARTMQLAQEVSGIRLEEAFRELLKRVTSNLPEYENAARVYETHVEPDILDFPRVGAHYGILSLFRDFAEEDSIYTFSVASTIHERSEVGRHRLAVGSVKIRSNITWKAEEVTFAALHLGGHNIMSGALAFMDREREKQMITSVHESFMNNDISEVLHLIDEFFENNTFSLKHLFKNEQRLIIGELLEAGSKDVYNSFRQLYDTQHPLIQALSGMNIPLPDYLSSLVKFILNADIHRNLKEKQIDFTQLARDVEESLRWSVDIDRTSLGYLVADRINTLTSEWKTDPEDITPMDTANSLLGILKPLNLELNLWISQVRYFIIGKEHYPRINDTADEGDPYAGEWLNQFTQLGDHLRVKIE
jgi:alpha-amylase/alpha-mannosidase (GH57 family)